MSFYRKLINIIKYTFFFLLFRGPKPTRSSTTICFYISLASLFIQFLVYLLILHTFEENHIYENIISRNQCSIQVYEDIKSLSSLSFEMGFSFILLDKQFLQAERSEKDNITINILYHPICRPAVLGIDSSIMTDKKSQLLNKLIDQDFIPVTFHNIQPLQTIPELKHVETAIFLQRTATFQVVILYPREDNTWWFGGIKSDPFYKIKLASLNLSLQNVELMNGEGTIERFEIIPSKFDDESYIMFPKNVATYLSAINHSKFVECNLTRAALFRSQFGLDNSAEAKRFRHKVWKMLSRVKTVLNSLDIVFWLSSGTALGYFRECDIIAYSKDVDIGVWASAYTEKIIEEMHNHGFRLKISLGLPNDSLELSFADQSGIKLDIFFFYKEDNNHYWNGGTQVKSGRKFKYSFPKFTLCWTFFKDIRLRVPCETETYIRANYGPNWFTPSKTWDWKTSPFNVQPNGLWKTEQLADAIKLYV